MGGDLEFSRHTWSPLLITTPPRLLDFCLSPFSGILSHFSNCLYDIQNLLGINGLCINIPIRYSEYLWVYFLERSIFSVEQQSTPGCPDKQSCFFFFFFCTPCNLESIQDIHSVSRRMVAMADFMSKDHSCTVSRESSWLVPWCSVMEELDPDWKRASKKKDTKTWPLHNCFSSTFLFRNPTGISPGNKVKATEKMETASKDPTGCELGEGGEGAGNDTWHEEPFNICLFLFFGRFWG